MPRYCSACGAERPSDATVCAECGALDESIAIGQTAESVTALLDEIDIWRAAGLLDAVSFERLRGYYERRRAELLPSPAPSAAPDEPVAAPPDTAEARVLVPPDSPPPQRPPALSIGEWAARRQADILLYLGAFLLVSSALIFASSQDDALSGGWRVLLLAVYTAAFIAAGALLQRWPRVREAGPAFLAIGALLTPLNFLLLHNEVLGDRDVSGALVWFAASVYSTAFYAFLFARGHGRLYAIPAAIALLNAWGSLAVAVGLPLEWGGAWWMGFALAATVVLSYTRRWSVAAAVPVAVIAALSLVIAILIVAFDASTEHGWQLPAASALLMALVAVAGWSLRQPLVLLAVVALAAVTGLGVVWAAELPEQWYSAPPLAAVVLLLLSRDLWSGWSAQLSRGSWLLVAAGLLWPFLLTETQLDGDSWGAAAAFLAAALLAAAVVWRNTSDGVYGPDWNLRSSTHPVERVAFAWLGFIAALVALGFAQRALEVARPDTGWAFAAVALVLSVSLAASARRAPNLLWAILPLLLLATAGSIQQPVDRFAGHDAVLLALPAAHLLAAFVLLRRWSLAAVAVALGMLALAALWEAQAWPWWRLAVLYAALAVPLFGALTPLRRYEAPEPAGAERSLAVQALSWVMPAVAVLTAAIALDARLAGAGIGAPGTAEYRALVLVTLLFAPLFAYEAWRLRRWEFAVPALAVVLCSAAALWPVFEWPTWTLAVAYSLAGAATFLALARWRRLGDDSAALAVQALSWAGLVLGPLTALLAVGVRLETIDVNPATLVEFRVLTALFLPLAAAVEFDGRRLGIGWAALPASALIMVALELAIATLEPANVQAHTIPAALYLAIVGLLARTPERLSRQLGWHELLQLAGAALLVLPQAEQGFDPGGARWGLVLLIEGIALLGIAMVLGARWLGVSGVFTLSGVALRFLWVNRDSDAVPYWVMLAVAGFVLLAIGLMVLLQRDWWDRTRLRLQTWWRRDAVLDARSPLAVPAPVLFAALAPVLAILAVGNPD